jgi:hypothetical protein
MRKESASRDRQREISTKIIQPMTPAERRPMINVAPVASHGAG